MARSSLHLSLIAVTALFFLIFVVEWALPVDIETAESTQIAVANAQTPAIEAAMPRPDTKELESRPLFAASRRSQDVLEATTEPTSDQNGAGLHLVGIISESSRRIALIQDPGSPTLRQVVEGQDIAQWKVKRIGVRSVTIEAAGVDRELKFSLP